MAAAVLVPAILVAVLLILVRAEQRRDLRSLDEDDEEE